jgi:1,4-alpha-glucan branching enzyme
MKIGSFIFVLHSHVPYVRKSGKWPHGEEMLFEIMAETYIPLLNSFEKLVNEKKKPNITLGLTPILLEQLIDPYMQDEFTKYLKIRIKSAKSDHELFSKSNPEFVSVNEFYINWYQNILNDFEKKYDKNLVDAFKYYQDHSGLDILTSAATHGYLPLLSRDSAIWGQLKTGVKQYKKLFGRSPTGIWLPECGYRPIVNENRVGIESFLEEVGLQYFFTDSHVIEAATGNNTGTLPILEPSDSYLNSQSHQTKLRVHKNPKNISNTETTPYTTFHPYSVGNSNVSVFGRDKVTGMQVWSADWGYPGDFVFREFHKKAPSSGIQYWKISNKKPGMKFKEVYNPEEAFQKSTEQANHFVGLVRDHLSNYYSQTGKNGVVVSSYDTELFGHWWFEGVNWLENVIRQFSSDTVVDLTSARQYNLVNQPTQEVQIPESSWGNGGQHSTWLNFDTQEIWPLIHSSEHRFELLAKNNLKATGIRKKFLNQAARELLLLQSSDWPFLITTVQARDYAEKRFKEHFERFSLLCAEIESGSLVLTEQIQNIFDADNIFKHIDFRDFA